MARTHLSIYALVLTSLFVCFSNGLCESGAGSAASISVVFGGDVALCVEAEKRIAKYGDGFVFSEIRGLLSEADIAAVNLEAPLTSSTEKAPKPTPGHLSKPVYMKCRPEACKALVSAGIDLAFLANNHIGDFEGGVVDTVRTLKQHSIVPVGAGANRREAYSPVFMDVRGAKLAFLAFSDIYPRSFEAGESRAGCAWADAKLMPEAIADARKAADLVFVNLHFGSQGTSKPTGRQKQLVQLVLKAGADMIIGNHPHVIQPVAVVEGKPVLFSIGNMVMSVPIYSWTVGLVARATRTDKKICRVDLLPIEIVDLAQPQLVDGRHVLEHLYNISKEFGDLPTIMSDYVTP